ncbi:GNAT family N-acetyltransferase [Salinibacillus xinjiangensis]|uniref:GNAT family N-acetyltransferase n=1 Tax=Salinibacillus xinjiangensis TaxID=1229268 RepID=A0A6G1X4C1_9BACI|nr:GNAT family N-acetyltransferase [Salinibacillus xinjiangensis]MRG85843.1 GNAT family N-acetyltransferase [Salinibacillus xinjiangensis]
MDESIFSQIPILETKHYVLRGLAVGDAQAIYPFLTDPETMKYITPHPIQSVAEVEDYVENCLSKYREQKEIPWVIESKEEKQTVGIFRFHKVNLWHQKAEMGVVIHPQFQGKGVMNELLATLLPFGFNDLGLNRVVGDIFADNKASEKLLLNYNFHKDGQLRQTDFDGTTFHDTVVYSLLKSEFVNEG